MSAEAENERAEAFPLGEYRALELLGRGGVGEVFVAYREGTKHLCALKRLRTDVDITESAQARIRREAHLATYLEHPNICRVLDAGIEDERFFLATEFIRGVDLERLIIRIARQGLAPSQGIVQALILEVLSGLTHAHEATNTQGEPLGIVHRDLSPRNIMVTFDGQVKIIDFGIARGQVDSYRTAAGVVLGTLKYLSPEQALGQTVDQRSDLYSVGGVFYRLCTGRHLYSGKKPFREAVQIIVNTTPAPMTDFNPAVTPDIIEAIDRALAKNRDDRYSSAAEMAVALREAGGPAAPAAAVGELIRSLFPEVLAKFDALETRARSLWSSTNAEKPPEDDAYAPTRAAAITQLHLLETQAQSILPDRASALPLELAETKISTLHLERVQRVTDASDNHDSEKEDGLTDHQASEDRFLLSSATPIRRPSWAWLLAATLLISAGLAVLGLMQTNKSPTRLDVPPSGPRAQIRPAPSAAPIPRPGVRPSAEARKPTEAPPSAVPAPEAKPPRNSEPERTPSKRPRTVIASPPRPRADPLRIELSQISAGLVNGDSLDPSALSKLLDSAQTRADKLRNRKARVRVQQARDCLATCSTEEKILAKARIAVDMINRLERENEDIGATSID